MIIIAFLVIVAIVFIGRFIFVKNESVPSEFLSARNDAALIAKDIVNSSSETAVNISEVSKLSAEGKYDDALNIVSKEIISNGEVQKDENNLLSQLSIMTASISKISSEDSAKSAVEAISIETKLIQNLMAYNQDLFSLLQTLQRTLLGQESGANQKIDDLVKKINDEAKTVNDLNQQFNDIMNKLDSGK